MEQLTRPEALLAVLRRQGVEHFAGVPCSTFGPLLSELERTPGLSYLSATSEGEAVAYAAGLAAAGRRCLVVMQNSGLGNAVNPLTSLIEPHGIPLLLLISHRGEPGAADEPQHALMGAITRELLALCRVVTHDLDATDFAAQLSAALESGAPTAWLSSPRRWAPAQPRPVAPPTGGKPPASESAVRVREVRPPLLTRQEALAHSLALLEGGAAAPALVATTGMLSRELYALGDGEHERANRFYLVGAMGHAAAFGLGVARGTARRVVVLDGDGALLMHLGCLATIGAVAPANLHHVVFDNRCYDSTGGQPTVSSDCELTSVARACGATQVATVDDAAGLTAALAAHLTVPGPTFLRILVRPGARPDVGRPRLSPRASFARFSAFLAAP